MSNPHRTLGVEVLVPIRCLDPLATRRGEMENGGGRTGELGEREINIRVGPHTAPRPDVVMPPVEVTVLSRFQGT